MVSGKAKLFSDVSLQQVTLQLYEEEKDVLIFVHLTLLINTGSLQTLRKVLKVIFAYKTSQ